MKNINISTDKGIGFFGSIRQEMKQAFNPSSSKAQNSKMKMLLVTFHLVLMFLAAHGQEPEIKLPAEVKSKFEAEFSTASTVSWRAISPSDYEADFINNGARKKVRYSDKGDILFLETSLFPGQLPQKVQYAIERDFSGYDIEQIREVKTKKKVIIRICVSKKETRYSAEIDLSGNIRRKHKINNLYEEQSDQEHNSKNKHKKKREYSSDEGA